MLFGLGLPAVLSQFTWGMPASALLVAILLVAGMVPPPPGALVFLVPGFTLAAWTVSLVASQRAQHEILRLKRAQEQEEEASVVLMRNNDTWRGLISSSRNRIEKVLSLTNVTNDLSSTLDLKSTVSHTMTWTRELVGRGGDPSVVLFDEQGSRIYRGTDGDIAVGREDPGPISLWVKERMLPLSVANLTVDPRFRGTGMESSGVKSLIAAPLVREKAVIGVLQVTSREPEQYTPEDWRLITLLGDLASVSIQNALLYQRTQEEAITDGLTEVYVHRYFQDRLTDEIKRSGESGSPLVLLMTDIDDFKAFNDTYGHPVGDAVLRSIARTLRDGVRGTDIVARYGGEEFAILLVETESEGGMLVAERLRAAVAGLSFAESGITRQVSVSVGLACFPADARDERTLIERADEALYTAKRGGKNRVAVWIPSK
jgi:diguanylate cyclase (GGDEF)-like protein